MPPPPHSSPDLIQISKDTAIVTMPGTPHTPDPHSVARYFRPLGHNRGVYYFMTSRGRQVLSIPDYKLKNKPTLYGLAPKSWWEREYKSDKGFGGEALDDAINFLIDSCTKLGVFRVDRIRGRGAWWDDDRSVLHAGDQLVVDGQYTPLQEINSQYVYEELPRLSIPLDDPLPVHESRKLIEWCRSIAWEKPVYGSLLAGWATIAPVCGALPWRPHIMVTGPSGAGKTWVTSYIHRLLGEWVIAAKGATTEAGLRQKLEHDALPVMWDEAEGETDRSARNIEAVLALMRQASSEVGGHIYKGGADGLAAEYTVRSVFCLSAIRVQLAQAADLNRVTVLTLGRGHSKQHFEDTLLPAAEALFTAEWCARFRARTVRRLDDLRANIRVFASVTGAYFKSSRVGDQLGPLMAGAWLAGNDRVATPEEARTVLGRQDWTDVVEGTETLDEEVLLNSLLEARIRVQADKAAYDLAVGEVVQIATGRECAGVYPSEAMEALARHGMRVDGRFFTVSNTHQALAKLLSPVGWGTGWGRVLRRLNGAQSTPDKVSFAGSQSRAVRIPLLVITNSQTDTQGQSKT